MVIHIYRLEVRGSTILETLMTVSSSGITLSENHLVVKTLFNGLLWVNIETHDLIHTSPGWALGPAPEQQLTPVQFLGTDEVATGTDMGQILILKMDSNKPTSTLDLHGGKRDLMFTNTMCLMKSSNLARPQALASTTPRPHCRSILT